MSNKKEDKPELQTYENKYTNYKYDPKLKTKNEQQSEDVERTINLLKKEGWRKWSKPLKKLPVKTYIKYVGKYKDGSIKFRNGGIILSNNSEKRYIALRNTNTYKRASWSVQYANLKDDDNKLVGVYYRELPSENPREIEKEEEDDDDKENKQQEEEKKEDANKDDDKPVTKDPKKELTDKQKERILNRVYYIEQHFSGRDRLYKTVQSRNYNISRKFVEQWLKKQMLHQLTTPSKASNPTGTKALVSKAPFNIIVADLTSWNDLTLNIVIDVFSRKAFVDIVSSKKPEDIKKSFEKLLKEMPKTPKMLLTDNGGEFKNETLRKFFEKKSINRIFTIPGNPQSNGIVERLNRTVKLMLNKSSLSRAGNVSEDDIKQMVENYNNTEHSSTGFSPNEALKPENHDKVVNNTKKSSKFNLDVKDDLQVGDYVRLRLEKDKIKKSAVNWTEELFQISSINIPRTKEKARDPSRPIRYKVKPRGDNTKPLKGFFHRDDLQKVDEVENEDKAVVKYEVEKILNYKKLRNKKLIYVKWKDYPMDEATWEPLQTIKNDIGEEEMKKLVDDYNERHKDNQIKL